MKISIITVCKNSEKTIKKAIESVVNQSCGNIEYIVVDGASQDRTIEIINDYGIKISKFVSEPDNGIFAAMNKGVRLSSGDFIYFLNSDDYLIDNTVIQNLIEFIDLHPTSELVYGDIDARDINDKYIYTIVPPQPEELMEKMIWGWVYHQAIFARKSLFDRHGVFNENIRVCADHDWLFRILESTSSLKYFPRKIASYSLGGVTAVPEKQATTIAEIFLVQNQVKTYQQQEWLSKRILKFQSAIIELSTELCEYRLQERNNQENGLGYAYKDLQHRLSISENKIIWMETSKFWQLRTQWFKFKNILGINNVIPEQSLAVTERDSYTPQLDRTPEQEIIRSNEERPIATAQTSMLENIHREGELHLDKYKAKNLFPIIAIDGVFFQIADTGIARIWRSLFEEWIESGFVQHIVVLDRNRTAPIVPGIEYRNIAPYDYDRTGDDARMLQFVCDEIGADLFISTYYTTPLSTPSVFMAYDMIPEVIEANLHDPMWREKHHGIIHACRYITISQSTANDLVKFYPQIAPDSIEVAYCGIPSEFCPAPAAEVAAFRAKHQIGKKYLLLVGSRMSLDGYKNAILLFRALQEFPQKNEIEIICIGGEYNLEPELAALAADISVHLLRIDDATLRVAFTGAMALVYPSRYEGFGLPIAEAMACGCPVITCRNSSIPEVAGDAAIYVDEDKIGELVDALSKVQNPELRQMLIDRGFARVKQFSWTKMAEIVANVLKTTAEEVREQPITPTATIWQEFRKMQAQMQELQLQPNFESQPPQSPADVASVQQPQPIEELISIAKNQLQQKLSQLAEVEAKLEIVESDRQLKKLPSIIATKLRPKLVPFISLLIGLDLLILLNIEVLYHPRSQLLFWSALTENLVFVGGANLLSVTLLLGIVGYYTKIDSRKLRILRSILGIVGATAIGLSILQSAHR